ncbi:MULTISPECIES: hypothetical protein [unclassified Saccharothrix]
MATDPADEPAAEPPQPPPADKAWLEVENVRGEDIPEEGSWPFERRG